MEAEDIERYLAELGTELKNRGLKKPVRVLLIGGAYMLLLANAARSTKDIDIFWLDEDGLQRAYAPLRESVQVIKQKHDLDAGWFNYLAQMLISFAVAGFIKINTRCTNGFRKPLSRA